jgi:hypothetical protein
MSTSEPRFPARFEPTAWEADLARTTPAGRAAAQTARRDYEADGVPFSHLRSVDEHGRNGTTLPNCAKVYLPQPNGRFGMVFKLVTIEGKLVLAYLAFGVRHHPKHSHALNVYDYAGARLLEIIAKDLRAQDPDTPAPPAQEEG